MEFGEWIPVTFREITAEERRYYCFPDDYSILFTCPLPCDGDEILISRNNGMWISLVTFCSEGGVGDEDGNDWINEVDAWMPLPAGYVKAETKQNDALKE